MGVGAGGSHGEGVDLATDALARMGISWGPSGASFQPELMHIEISKCASAKPRFLGEYVCSFSLAHFTVVHLLFPCIFFSKAYRLTVISIYVCGPVDVLTCPRQHFFLHSGRLAASCSMTSIKHLWRTWLMYAQGYQKCYLARKNFLHRFPGMFEILK